MSFHKLFFLGYLAHNPTKTKAPAYTLRGAKPPMTDSSSPGPRYYVQPSITRHGKHTAPAQHICGLPKVKTEITPGPSEYHFSSTSFRQDKRAFLLPCATGVQNVSLHPEEASEVSRRKANNAERLLLTFPLWLEEKSPASLLFSASPLP